LHPVEAGEKHLFQKRGEGFIQNTKMNPQEICIVVKTLESGTGVGSFEV